MKIAIDARFLGRSGIGTYIENVLFYMFKNHPEHEYLLITCSEKYAVQLDNVKSIICNICPFSLKELFFFPVAEINKCDVFYSPYINLPIGIKVPICSTIHDVLFLDVDGLVSSIGKYIRRLFLWRAIKISKTVFTVSKFSENRIKAHFKRVKNVLVTYCGVPHKVLSYDNSKSEKEDYFIFVGNVKTHKGLGILVDAFNNSKKAGLSSKLYIVGENKNFRTNDENFNKKISSSSDICFTGFVTDEKLLNLVSCAKALILPSFYEGFGLPPLEALYLKTNVILSDIEVFKEIYSGLPVVFFESGNPEELEKCMMNVSSEIKDADSVREHIAQRYNFAKVADVILQQLLLVTKKDNSIRC